MPTKKTKLVIKTESVKEDGSLAIDKSKNSDSVLLFNNDEPEKMSENAEGKWRRKCEFCDYFGIDVPKHRAIAHPKAYKEPYKIQTKVSVVVYLLSYTIDLFIFLYRISVVNAIFKQITKVIYGLIQKECMARRDSNVMNVISRQQDQRS